MKLNHRKYGNSAPPLIIVHGLYGASDNWVSIARNLSEQYEVYLIDQRNHGDSPWSDTFNYEVMKEDLREFMDEHQIDKAVLMGHSMGGKTVMFFARDYPGRVQSLIVVDIAPIPYHDLALSSHFAANHGKMIEAMMDLNLDELETREDADKALATKIGSPRIRMFLLKNLTRDENQQFAWKINLPVLHKNLDTILDGLDTDEIKKQGGIKGFPALFISGEQSGYITPETHSVIKETFPAAEIVTIPDTGHWVHAEKPDLFLKNINYFLG